MSSLLIRNARPAEYGRIGDLTIAAYAALPVDHLWGGYADEIRDVAAAPRRRTCSSPSTRSTSAMTRCSAR